MRVAQLAHTHCKFVCFCCIFTCLCLCAVNFVSIVLLVWLATSKSAHGAVVLKMPKAHASAHIKLDYEMLMKRAKHEEHMWHTLYKNTQYAEIGKPLVLCPTNSSSVASCH
jgi:hypothetical protein